MKKCIMIFIALIYSFLGVQMLFATDTIPNQFKFTAKTKAALNTVCTSNTIKVSGIDTATPISIVGGTYSVNGGPYTAASGTVVNGNTVTLQQTSSGSCSTKTDVTLTIGGVFDTFSVTTVPPDTTPKKFKLIDQKNVALSTVITSNTITVLGINVAAPISIVGGTYSINDGLYTSAPGTVNNTDTVTVQLMSAASFSTTTLATLTIGGVSDTFGVKTLAADPKPDAFTFIPQTNVDLGQVITSNAITVSGINTAAPISIVGGTYKINGGPYIITPGTVENGDTVTLQLISAGIYKKKTTATLTIGKVKGAFSVTTLTFTTLTFNQADLTGTWRINFLTTGSSNRWFRAIATSNSSGLLTISHCLDSTEDTHCPPAGSIQWTINASGVITETGTHSSPDAHYTMTSNKNFIAGTATEGLGEYDLRIVQKVVTGTSYSNADVRNKSFVYHQLNVGGENEWEYGAGTSDSAGLLTIISGFNSSSGSLTPGSTGCTLSVNTTTGVVTSTGASCGSATTFQGFLSDDKKTIVGTQAGPGEKKVQALLIIQITGAEFTVGALPAGISASHLLGCGTGWIHNTITVDGSGGMTFSDWVDSFGGSAPVGTYTGNITDTSGTLLIDGNLTYQGQISHDGKFTVGTQTNSGHYFLNVTTQ